MRLIIGITGASGAILGIETLRALQTITQLETHLIISNHAIETINLETSYSLDEVVKLATVSYPEDKISASIASGSFRTDGMVVIPCSMNTLAAIANGYDGNLIQRAADVCLKEGRKVVLVPREMPLNRIHLRNLNNAAEAGCVILPPMLTFYHHPQSISEIIDYLIGKIFMQFNLAYPKLEEWKTPEL
jgi:4-hydroxy-3-polyprenylbenzoate decarboxylase